MKKNNSYPLQLVKVFRAGEITRQQFINKFTLWQKSCGINFDCKGYADKSGVYITYRGIKAEIRNGLLCWKNNTAKTIREMKNKIDIYAQGEKWS